MGWGWAEHTAMRKEHNRPATMVQAHSWGGKTACATWKMPPVKIEGRAMRASQPYPSYEQAAGVSFPATALLCPQVNGSLSLTYLKLRLTCCLQVHP